MVLGVVDSNSIGHPMRVYPIKNLVPDSFFLACSGGIDSIACAHLIASSRKSKARVFHFNHKFQPLNDQMESSVVKLCSYLGIECVIMANDNSHSGNGVEDRLRNARIAAYQSLNDNIITCHHLDDATESYLMNCFSGTPHHLPIPTVTKLDNSIGSIYRPFLTLKKDDLIEYAKRNDLMKYVVEDPTNQCQDYRRNWVRGSLIPQLTEKKIGVRTVVLKRYLSEL